MKLLKNPTENIFCFYEQSDKLWKDMARWILHTTNINVHFILKIFFPDNLIIMKEQVQ